MNTKDQLVDALRRFCELAASPLAGSSEDDQQGMAIDIEFAFEQTTRFSQINHRIDGDVIYFELEWLGTGRALIDLWRDFYSVFHDFAEGVQFIRCAVDADAVLFQMIFGCGGGPEHSHFVLLRVVGPRVRNVIAWLRNPAG